jgi:hypothetical protein
VNNESSGYAESLDCGFTELAGERRVVDTEQGMQQIIAQKQSKTVRKSCLPRHF